MKRHERNVKETLSKIPKILRINNQTAYEFVKVLGFGGYAVAFSAKLVNVEEKDDDKMNVLNGPDMVAIKIIIKNNFDSNKMKQVTTYTEREIKIMSKLNHTNIVKLYDHWIDDNCIYIILELCINKTLTTIIKDDSFVLTTKQARQFIYEIANGCLYMHSHLIVHRDLKPENILLDQDYRAKIADFGLSVELKSINDQLYTFCGTLKYQAPEMIQRKGYSFGVDIWALGCVSYRLYYGNVPFDGQTNDEIYKAIVSKCPKYCRVSKCNESIENHEILVLKSMLHKNVDLRAKIDTLLQNEKYFLLEKNNPQLNHNKKRASIQELANLQTINLSNKRKRSQSQDVNNMIQCLQKISSKKKLSPNNVEAKNKLNSNKISYKMHNDTKLIPSFWITQWIEINLIGFGYLFDKSLYGFQFKRNSTHMMLIQHQNKDPIIAYEEHDKEVIYFMMNQCPEQLKNNLSVLKQSYQILLDKLKQTQVEFLKMRLHTMDDENENDLPWIIKKWFHHKYDLMMFHLETDLFQLTFIQDNRTFLFDCRQISMSVLINNSIYTSLNLKWLAESDESNLTSKMHCCIVASLKYIQMFIAQ